MYLTLLVTQGIIPMGLLLWQGLSHNHSQLSWILKSLLVATGLGVISLTGLWSVFFPWWTPYLFWVIWAVLTLITYRRARKTPPWPRRTWGRLAYIFIVGLLAGLLGSIALQAAIGLRLPAIAPVSLTFPLTQGTYQVLNGGNHMLINAHLKTLEAPFRNYRGQSYGVDLVKINALGTRASGLLPKDLNRYEIYGETVLAPCDGRVISTENQRPEMVPPTADRDYLLGNHVLLRCETADILLAHFQPKSVLVKLGEVVKTGQPLGTVGNSGNTNEPHLHIHAQRPGHSDTPIDGEPLPIVFGDRYLVRNARIKGLKALPPPVTRQLLL